MKIDLQALALRLTLAWFLLSMTALFLYLAGAAESFLEPVQAVLFQIVRGFSWIGLLVSWCLLVPLNRKRKMRFAASLSLGTAFTLIFGFVLFWGSWVYPHGGYHLW